MTTIDGTDITSATIDGQEVQEITVDGDVVWSATVQLTTDSTLNGGGIDVTVYEDTDGDGVANNQQTVTLTGGVETFELDQLQGSSGSDYWAELALSSSDPTASPVITSVDLELVDAWNTATEWDNAQSESRVVHEAYTDLAAGDVQLGYPSYMNALVALYPLDEDSGSTAYEYASGLDGTNNGCAVGQAGGVVNTSRYYFDGNGDYVDLGSPAALQLKNDFTIAGWVSFDNLSSSQRALTTWANSQSTYPFHVVTTTSGNLRFNQDAIGSVDSASSFSTNTLTFFAVSKDANDDVRFYFDGSPDANNPQSVGSQTSDGDGYCTLGRAGSQYMYGYENFMMFFNTTLSDSEVKDLYDRTSSGSLVTGKKTA